ncbi:MAG: Virulence factor Mce family protein [Amycolatopsis sp.]|uniref:MCE family protein n=1 Tax=Amycolatopsis sp. TaxID=37632 RepID=UPI0026194751|nr:MCE family protein [Amycolatopsis sp.]MCU1685373.1 Virulence factor Mce family protein [Amycolatopsis sp.]
MKTPPVVILACLAVVLNASGCSAWSSPKMTITAQFADSVGLYVGNDVDMLGIPVGSVTKIEPHGTEVTVELQLDAGTQIPASASAVTVSPSIVTDRHVELTPPYRGGPLLRDGDLIPLDRTHTPIEIDRVIKAVDQLAGELSKTDDGSAVLKDATGVAADNLAGNGDEINKTITALSGAVGSLADKRDALTDLITKVDALTKAAADNDSTIKSFTSDLTQASGIFANDAPALGDALTSLNSLLDETVKLINDNRTSAQNTLKGLKNTAGTITAHTRELAESADVLPLLFQNLANAVDPATGQLRVHIDPAETLLDGQLVNGLCLRIKLALPGCASGKIGDFGPDLGMTELLLGAAK